VDPRRWEFSASEHGRPEIAGPEAAHGLSFNLSRARDLVACAIARGAQVGVDVAAIDSGDEPMLVAERFFQPAEIADLRSLPLHLQRGRFFDFWTLKEAYVKALGRGLRIPLGGFSFHLGQSISLEIEGAPEGAGAGWQFALWSPTPVHRAALAVRTASGQPMTTRTEWWDGEQPVTSSAAPTLGS
jgi:4'-phosphopantetheinyl transferase